MKALFVSTASNVMSWVGGYDGDWLNPKGWSPEGLPGPATKTLIKQGSVMLDCGFVMEIGSLFVDQHIGLNISSAGGGSDGSSSASHDYASDTIGLKVNESAVLGGSLSVGSLNQKCTSRLSVAGDLVLTNGTGKLKVYAGTREEWDSPEMFREGGARVEVGGTMRITDQCAVRPFCDQLSGAPVVFKVGNLQLDQGGLIDGNDAGYTINVTSDGTYVGHAPGAPKSDWADKPIGGSYGGLGGGDKTIPTYGTDFAPYRPGSPGGNRMLTPAGGAIRICCERTARIEGTIRANVKPTWYYGGGSGGAIWVTARDIESSETASLQAIGAAPMSGWPEGKGGGGGRICLAARFPQSRIDEFYTLAELPKAIGKIDLRTDATPLWKGTVNVDGGSIDPDPDHQNGHPGTAVFLTCPPSGTLLMVR